MQSSAYGNARSVQDILTHASLQHSNSTEWTANVVDGYCYGKSRTMACHTICASCAPRSDCLCEITQWTGNHDLRGYGAEQLFKSAGTNLVYPQTRLEYMMMYPLVRDSGLLRVPHDFCKNKNAKGMVVAGMRATLMKLKIALLSFLLFLSSIRVDFASALRTTRNTGRPVSCPRKFAFTRRTCSAPS